MFYRVVWALDKFSIMSEHTQYTSHMFNLFSLLGSQAVSDQNLCIVLGKFSIISEHAQYTSHMFILFSLIGHWQFVTKIFAYS